MADCHVRFWRSPFFPIAFSASPVRNGDKNDPAVDARLLLESEEEEDGEEGKEERERIEQKYRSEDIRDSGPVSILDRPSSLFAA